MRHIWNIQRIGLFSAFKSGFVVGGILAFTTGIIAAAGLIMFSALIMAAVQNGSSAIGIVMAIILPLTSSVAGAVIGGGISFLAALAYNLTAGLLGGLEIEMEEKIPETYNDIYGEFDE